MFIQTEATPNPATLKFLPGRPVLENGTLDLREPAEAAKSPLAERLFSISGVSGVFFGSDFITVTKNGGEWQQLKPMILGAIMEHFMSGEPLIARGEAEPSDADEFFERPGSAKGHAPGERLRALDIEADDARFGRGSQCECCQRSYRRAGIYLEACLAACEAAQKPR